MLKNKVIINTKINEVFAKKIVTYKIFNNSSSPIKIEISDISVNFKNEIFSSFYAKIGNSTFIKSKVIKTEKADEYNDSISLNNFDIPFFTYENDNNKILVKIKNIPPKEELTFITEFIELIEYSDNKFEYELFKNLPQINGKKINIKEYEFEGILEINTKNNIKNFKINFLPENIKIKEEEKNNNKILIKYEYNILKTSKNNKVSIAHLFNKKLLKQLESSYTPSSKILLELESNNIIIFSQKLNKTEKAYMVNYKLIQNTKKINSLNNGNIKLSPALFIFLIDESGSMVGSKIEIASKALLLFLQSLPEGSYYQLIGFGSHYKFYDESPKEYNQKNIENSMKIVKNLNGYEGTTKINDVFKAIYNSKNYDNIYLPRNIFLLTDDDIKNKNEILDLIEINSYKFSVYSFKIGNENDEYLIKNSDFIGEKNYSFCRDINELNQFIVSSLNNICVSYIYNFKINSSLDKNNLYKLNNSLTIIKENKIYHIGYINENSDEESNKKLNFNIKYCQNQQEFSENGTI